MSWTMFGKGPREDLDDEDATVLTKQIRACIKRELAQVDHQEGPAALQALWGQREKERAKI